MKTPRFFIPIFGISIGALLYCSWLFRKSVSPNEKLIVAEPYQGIRMESEQISRAVIQAQNGSVQDAIILANHYYFVQRDLTNAIKYLKIAAEHGSADAAFNLGQVYSTDTRPRDLNEAKHWYGIAEKLGDNMASEKLDKLRLLDKPLIKPHMPTQ